MVLVVLEVGPADLATAHAEACSVGWQSDWLQCPAAVGVVVTPAAMESIGNPSRHGQVGSLEGRFGVTEVDWRPETDVEEGVPVAEALQGEGRIPSGELPGGPTI